MAATTTTSKPIFLKLSLILLCFSLLPSALAITSRTRDGYTINGQVKIPGLDAQGFGLLGKLSGIDVILNGGQRVTFLRPDGYFSLLKAYLGKWSSGCGKWQRCTRVFIFSLASTKVRIDVSAQHPGKVQVALTENKRVLTELVLQPLRVEQYYEIREPFSIMSLVKSPVGIMMGFMLIVMFVTPKLAENTNPGETNRAQEGMRNQGGPSFTNVLPGAGRSYG